jgi:oligogalacturonide lyase
MAYGHKGKVWPSERKTFTDRITGIPGVQLTHYKGHSHHLYFTENGWYDEDRRLLFISDRDNKTNLFSIEIESGEITQLTDLDGEFENISACLKPDGSEVYYRIGRQLYRLDLATLNETKLYEGPEGFNVGQVSCTCDGAYVVTALCEDLSHRITLNLQHGYVGHRELMEANPLCRILRIPTAGGEAEIVHEEHAWVGHVNASPTEPDLITFCHEGPWQLVDHRIWGLYLSKGEAWPIRPRKEELEMVGHEFWHDDGVHIGYHGFRRDGTGFFGSCHVDGSDEEEVEFQFRNWHAYSHGPQVVVDGRGDVTVMVYWKKVNGSFTEPKILCEHRCSFHSQNVHAHPRFSPNGKQMLFTSDKNGYGNLYLVDIPDDPDSLPAYVKK